jgi:S-adenosylmethionine:tRNA ribosyltransferase-isomerase
VPRDAALTGPCNMRGVRRQDFSYDLPEELIAQSPLAERSASRLLVLDGGTGAVADRRMDDLPAYLRAGDLLVFNDTRVVAARIVGSKPSGGRVEIFLERVVSGADAHAGGPGGLERQALVQLRASKPIREGLEIATAGGVVRVLGREEDLWRVELPGHALEFFETWGEVPLPPYIHRAAGEQDRERYQSIFAREKGAVAAPTASLHFDAALVDRLDTIGVERAFITLHVGAGTFQPLRTENLDEHKMHAERVSVSRATWEAIGRTRARGGRVVAVGTTVVRALESAAMSLALSPMPTRPHARAAECEQRVREGRAEAVEGEPRARTAEREERAKAVDMEPRAGEAGGGQRAAAGPAGPGAGAAEVDQRARATEGEQRVAAAHGERRAETAMVEQRAGDLAAAAWSGETRLFIRPGFKFQIVDAMVTNFHLPESTLLMLVSAFAGRENVLRAYAHAVRERYRFFSYGDAMLITPTPAARSARTTDSTGTTAP